jgi:hypothetical protein
MSRTEKLEYAGQKTKGNVKLGASVPRNLKRKEDYYNSVDILLEIYIDCPFPILELNLQCEA